MISFDDLLAMRRGNDYVIHHKGRTTVGEFVGLQGNESCHRNGGVYVLVKDDSRSTAHEVHVNGVWSRDITQVEMVRRVGAQR